jgi:hypothetical protein
MCRCDPSGVDPAFSFLTGGIAALNHRLIAWTPPASLARLMKWALILKRLQPHPHRLRIERFWTIRSRGKA